MLPFSAAVAAAAALSSSGPEVSFGWEEKWTTSFVDNFNGWASTSAAIWQQRYLINTTYWKPGGPIFFYTGNEGDITLFAANTGFMWELAPNFNAMLVFAEHRYYGESMPFGSASYDNDNLAFLSSEQALADYAALLDSLKSNMSIPDAPVISFGGSYGGMLSAFFRMKYPASTLGAISASAPIRQFTGITDPTVFNAIITRTFKAANPIAPQAIYNSWGLMTTLSQSASGRQQLESLLGLCPGQIQQPSDIYNVFNWISNAIGYMAMADYPYPASFLGPMPAWPVAAAAQLFTDANAPASVLLPQIRNGIAQIFYNYTGQAGSCYNLSSLMPPGLAGNGWNVQSCMEMVMPIGQYGMPVDMFWPAAWNLSATVASCVQQFQTVPRPNMVRIQYGVLDLSSASNIVFSNGNLDPWSGGGVLQNMTGNPSIIAVVIDQGAHHLDLRASNPSDPPSVITARQIEANAIASWLAAAAVSEE